MQKTNEKARLAKFSEFAMEFQELRQAAEKKTFFKAKPRAKN